MEKIKARLKAEFEALESEERHTLKEYKPWGDGLAAAREDGPCRGTKASIHADINAAEWRANPQEPPSRSLWLLTRGGDFNSCRWPGNRTPDRHWFRLANYEGLLIKLPISRSTGSPFATYASEKPVSESQEAQEETR
uniref:Uncharacterized protein n=1 Tax=Sphaerodactylus townsendi TaxID=933632 RepID=A0ACB8FWE9_9SAUR